MNDAGPIAVVCPRYPAGRAVGGAETLLRRLAEHMAARGLAVDFLTTCAEDHHTWTNTRPPGWKILEGVRVGFFPVDEQRDAGRFRRAQERISRGREVSPREERDWMEQGVNAPALYRHLEEEGAGYRRILAGPYLFGLTWNTLRIRPEQSLLVPCLHDEPFARPRLVREMFRSARGCLFNSAPEMDLARRLYGIPEDRCAVVGMGVDPFEADPRRFAAARGLDRPYLLYCGRREPLKGTPLLMDYVHAFRQRTGRALNLVLTGVGDVHPPAGFESGLVDAGCLSEMEKREAMAGALAFCHPSVNESLGIVLLESWMAGVPALVHGGGAVLVDQCRRSGGGLWFRSYPEFEEALLLLLDDPPLRARMGRSGKAFVERAYSWESVGRRLFAALERL